jgi:hypothetical protein
MVSFHVGQKVVCIRDDWSDGSPPLRNGAIYTVVGITAPIKCFSFGGPSMCRPTIILAEAKNPNGDDIGFNHERFRPVIERKTDISIFTAMLNAQRTGVNA